MRREYGEKWIIESNGNSGGQGNTFIVKKNDSTENEETYLLKLLKEQGNSERRERFCKEVQALKILNMDDVYELNNENIKYFPKIVDDNCDKYINRNIELYYVMEYIQGKELDKVISSKKYTLDEILESFMNLLNSVYICHGKNIIHRDIKPANIMCRDGKLNEIVLIDFGISYIKDFRTDDTKIGQELENRFLHLPEKAGHSKEAKRKECSDITYCCGILFYMLTRKNPKHLKDENGRKPHEKFENIINLQWVGSEKLKILNAIFDQGFEYDIDKRFQSIEELIRAINKINRYPEKEYIYDNKIKSFCLTTVLQSLKLTEKNNNDAKVIIERMRIFENMSISLGFCKLFRVEKAFYLDGEDLWINNATISYYIENDLNYMFIPRLNLNEQTEVIEDIELYATIKFTNNKKIRMDNFYVNVLGRKQELLSPLDEENKMVIDSSNDAIIKCEFIESKNLFAYLCENGKLKVYDLTKSSIIYEQMIDDVKGKIQKCIFSYKFEYIALIIDNTIEVYMINKENTNQLKLERIILPKGIYNDNKYFLDIKFSNKNNILLIMTESNIYNYNINTNVVLNKKIKKLKVFSIRHGEILTISNNDEKLILKLKNRNQVLNINTLEFEKDIYLPSNVGYIKYNINNEIEIINSDYHIWNEDCYSLYGYHNIKIGNHQEETKILNVGEKYIYYIDKWDGIKIYDKISRKEWTMYKHRKQVNKEIRKVYISRKEKYIAILYEHSKIEIIMVNK